MPITKAQREQRKKHIGSSDMAAILGLDPYRNAYDVFLEKKGRLVEERDPDEKSQLTAGNRFESGVLEFARDQLGELRRNVYRALPSAHLGAHIDAIVKAAKEPVEGKTAGLFGPVTEQWGEPGTDEVPERVIVQGMVHMLCVGAEVCHVPAFIGGRGFLMYRVQRSEELGKVIIDRAITFWERHVLRDIPPDDCVPSLEIVRRVRRQPNKTILLPLSLKEQWEQAKQAVAVAKALAEKAEAELLAAMGDAEAADFGDSGKILTCCQQTRKAYTVKESTYSVLRMKARPALPAPTVQSL
jgi:putative phage-type endonuclease